jgi:hypothetical protein
MTIYADYGRNLRDRDFWPNGDSDPYTDWNDEYPDWEERIDFGVDTWRKFKVSVWDEDYFSDDRLSSTYTWYLPSSRSKSATGVRSEAYEGYVVFNYTYT